MCRQILAALTLAVAVSSTTLAQSVSYEKYRLDNGLTVILHEDHTLPMACVNLWYRVGSKDEKLGRSGFAHLFEHLMFMGTRRVAGSDFDNIMEAGGGWNNASTSEDRTNYFEMGPAELLPTLLWLEADRLEDLGKEMTTEKVDKQRDVVRNERRQSYENAPYGKSALRVYDIMFPPGHPYHHTVIGSHEDLEAATVTDVKDFFATYYVPSNASLVVAGDFDPADTKALIDRLFGSLPRGSDVLHGQASPVSLDRVIRLTMTDAVQFARTSFIYHSPARFAPGDADMDLTAAVLSSGISSRLYQKLVYKDKLAVDVAAYQESMMLGSLFHVQATARPGVSLDTVEAAMDDVISNFVSRGPTKEELERQKAGIEYGMVSSIQSILSKADQLNSYEFFYGEPDSFSRDLDRYRDATVASVRDQARSVLNESARLILRVIPEIRVAEDNPRDQRPAPAKTRDFAPLMPNTFQLSNGITVYHWRRSELPLVSLSMLLPGGSTLDGPGKSGLASLTANMLDEGAAGRSAVEFADALDALGATFSARAGLDSTTATLSVLAKKFPEAIKLYSDAILRPSFADKEWQRVHNLHIQRLKRDEDRPTTVARRVAMKVFFGDKHPYSRPTVGTINSVTDLTLGDIKRFHARLYRPANAVFLVAGDLTERQAKDYLESAFGQWSDPGDVPNVTPPAFSSPANTSQRVVIVDRPDAVQTVVRFMMPAGNYADPNRTKLALINTILGGSFTSRLNQNLREKHGYTYGARCGFVMNPPAGYFTASSSVRADVTGASIGEFLKEFQGLRTGNITATETGKSKSTRRMQMMQTFSGLRGIINAATTLVLNHRPFKELGEELSAVARVKESQLNRLAYQAVPLEQSLLVLVGDKKTILKQLADLNLPTPTELTPTGDPKNN